MITADQLKACMPYASDKNRELFLDPLNKTMDKYQVNTMRRAAAFLAQLEHESGSLQYVKELASGEAYDTGELAKMLGNTQPGDGPKFKGRGLIQITGRANYTKLAAALNLDLLNQPELLEQPINAALSAGWFWFNHGLNELADDDNYVMITRRINGGLNGWSQRLQFWMICEKALNVTPLHPDEQTGEQSTPTKQAPTPAPVPYYIAAPVPVKPVDPTKSIFNL